jgi:hypothetical protein
VNLTISGLGTAERGVVILVNQAAPVTPPTNTPANPAPAVRRNIPRVLGARDIANAQQLVRSGGANSLLTAALLVSIVLSAPVIAGTWRKIND